MKKRSGTVKRVLAAAFGLVLLAGSFSGAAFETAAYADELEEDQPVIPDERFSVYEDGITDSGAGETEPETDPEEAAEEAAVIEEESISPDMAPGDKVEINATNFPDEKFRNYVKENCDLNHDGTFASSELQAVKEIDCRNRGIANLQGIEFFPELDQLWCNGNKLTELDVSGNKKLWALSCNDNMLTELDLSGLEVLKYLYCNYNNIASLKVDGCEKLYWLQCHHNKLIELDVSTCAELCGLQCYENEIESLTISGLNKLDSVDCNSNALVSLEISNCPMLRTIDCRYNQIETLNISDCASLTELYCNVNKLKSLNVSALTKLKHLYCQKNELKTLDVTHCPDLLALTCYVNDLSELDLSNNTKLQYFSCHTNKLTSLDLSHNPELYFMSCRSNRITTLDVTANPILSGCYLHSEPQYTPEYILYVLSSEVATDNTLAIDYGTSVTALEDTDVVQIDATSFPDENFRDFVRQYYDLNDNGMLSTGEIKAAKRIDCINEKIGDLTGIKYFTDLLNLSCGRNQLTSLDVSGLTSLGGIYCESNQLESINISGCTGLIYLDCWGNRLQTLDTTENGLLKDLICNSNRLSELDLSLNTELERVVCMGNELTNLTISGNRLCEVYCFKNRLDTLDLTYTPLIRNAYLSPSSVTRENGTTQFEDKDGNLLYVDDSTDLSGSSILINDTNFPDANFREFVKTTYDKDENDKLTVPEILGATVMQCQNEEISNFTGIGNFTGLKELYCYGNELTATLDLSSNTKLERLGCNDCGLTSLNLNANTALQYLDCDDNSITSLDLSKNPELNHLWCEGNAGLAELDISKNPYLLRAVQNGECDTSFAFDDRYYDYSESPYCELRVDKSLQLIVTENKAENLRKIEIRTSPDKIAYTEGETFDPTGMEVTATYSDDHTADIPIADCVITPAGPLTRDVKSVTVSYTVSGLTKTAVQSSILVKKAEEGNTLSGTVKSSDLKDYRTYVLTEDTTLVLDAPEASIYRIECAEEYNLTIKGSGMLDVRAGLQTKGSITIEDKAYVTVKGEYTTGEDKAVDAIKGITVKGSAQLNAEADDYALYSADKIIIADNAGVYASTQGKAIFTTGQDGIELADGLKIGLPTDAELFSDDTGTWFKDSYEDNVKILSIYPEDTIEELTAVTDVLDFGTAVEGYSAIPVQTAVIKNTGKLTVDIKDISGASPMFWHYGEPDKMRLKPGEEAIIKVRPNTGLKVDTPDDNDKDYSDAIIITTNKGAQAIVDLKFTVEKRDCSIGVSEETLDFGGIPTKTDPQLSKKITVTNTGNVVQDFKGVVLDHQNTTFEDLYGYKISGSGFPCRLAPGESATFRISPTMCRYTYDYSNTIRISSVQNPSGKEIICKTVYFAGEDGIWIQQIPDQTYTGSQIKPEINVLYGSNEFYVGHKLTPADYTVSWKNNTNVYTIREGEEGFSAKKAPTVIIKGKGNYTGSITKNFVINPRNVDVSKAPYDEWALPAMASGETDDLIMVTSANITLTYNGKVQRGTCKITDKLPSGKTVTLKAAKDYDLEYPDKGYTRDGNEITGDDVLKAPGLYVITVKGKGNYSGERKLLMEIVDATSLTPVSKLSIPSIPAQTYKGKQIVLTGNDDEAKVRALDKKGNPFEWKLVDKSRKTTLQAGKHYTLLYSNNTNIGTATVTIIGKREAGYAGAVSKTFKINGTSLSKMKQEGFAKSVYYDGSPRTQALKFYYTTGKGASLEKYYLEEGTDYTVSYRNNVNRGTATAVYSGHGAYTGTVKKKFKITGYPMNTDPDAGLKVYYDDDGTEVLWPSDGLPEFAYTKGGSVPKPIVKYRTYSTEEVLKEKTDYTLSWSNNGKVNDGSDPKKVPTLTIKGKGRFAGSFKRNFKVTGGNIAYCPVSSTDMVYQDKAGICRTNVTVRDRNGKVLKAGTDYYKANDKTHGFKYTYADPCTVKGADGTPINVAAGSEVLKEHVIPEKTVIYVTLTGKGRYEGTTTGGIFRVIRAPFKNAKIKIAAKTYTGDPVLLKAEDFIEAKIKINGAWSPLVAGTDYTVKVDSYVNNVKAGTAKVTVVGKGIYGGFGNSKVVNFKIVKKKLNYSVKFDANGGSGKMKAIDIVYGSPLPKSTFWAPAGKTFIGWSDTPSGDVKFTNKEEFRPNVNAGKQLWSRLRYGADIVLYAKWG
ncbi:MAG: hypothetical protein K6F53_01045 [Lachnospiraceae bacterium]|nr:hypothetical protein [Lachnospiraceae bacterium]